MKYVTNVNTALTYGTIYASDITKHIHYVNESGTSWNLTDSYSTTQANNNFLSASTEYYDGQMDQYNIAYGDATNKISGDSSLTWNPTTGDFRASYNNTINDSDEAIIIANNSTINSNSSNYNITIGTSITQTTHPEYKLSIGHTFTNASGIWVGYNFTQSNSSETSILYGETLDVVGGCVCCGSDNTLGWKDVVFGTYNVLVQDDTNSQKRVVFGVSNTISGSSYSMCLGYYNNINTNLDFNFCFGNYTVASNEFCGIIGYGVDANTSLTNDTYNSIAIGSYSDTPTMWITGGDGTVGSQGRVGVRENTPTGTLHVKGEGTAGATDVLILDNSSSSEVFSVTDDGTTFIAGDVDVTGSLTATTVYCDDLYTSGSSLHLGDLTLSDNGRNLDLSSGGVIYKLTGITLDYTIGSNDEDMIVLFTGEDGVTLTLTGTSLRTGQIYIIKNVSETESQMNLDSSANIDGASSYELAFNTSVTVTNNGTTWYIIGDYIVV